LKLKLPARDAKFIEFTKVETFLEAAGPRMCREINGALGLFQPGQDEEDTVWEDMLKAVKQVKACRKRDVQEDKQSQDVQALIGEVRRLQGLVGDRAFKTPAPLLVSRK
jgi:hypothetical protein